VSEEMVFQREPNAMSVESRTETAAVCGGLKGVNLDILGLRG